MCKTNYKKRKFYIILNTGNSFFRGMHWNVYPTCTVPDAFSVIILLIAKQEYLYKKNSNLFAAKVAAPSINQSLIHLSINQSIINQSFTHMGVCSGYRRGQQGSGLPQHPARHQLRHAGRH